MNYIEIFKNDYDIFHELATAYYREGEDADTPQEDLDAFIQFMFKKVINHEINGCFVKEENTYIGFALWVKDTEGFDFSEMPGFGTILEIGLLPLYRSSGRGKEFVTFIENSLCEKGVSQFYVCAYGPAQRFWAHCGYEECGKIARNGLPIMIKAGDKKYIDLLKEYGIDLKIVHVEEADLPVQNILEKGSSVEIQLNLSKIPKAEYETYLSYNVRKRILPKLKLETKRLKIRRFEIQDADAMFEFLKDRESCSLDGGYEPYTEKNEDYYDLMSELASEETRYAIVRKDTDEAIGMIHLMECNDRAVEVMEIGYTMNPSQRRCGYATEAVEAVLRYLLQELHLDMVIAGVLEENKTSLKMIEKLGFVFEGRKHKALYHSVNGPSDLLYFYIERS